MKMTRVDVHATHEPMDARVARIARSQIQQHGTARVRVIFAGEPYKADAVELRKCRGVHRWEATTVEGLTHECDGLFWA